jgi:hypothetical protein
MARPARDDELLHLLRRHQKPAKSDRRAARDEYLRAVDALHAQIRTWLAKATDEGLVRITSGGTLDLSEEGAGKYAAPILLVDVGRFVGARGRIDVDAGDRSAMLVLRMGGWHFVERAPRARVHALTQASFTEAMRELLGE